MNFYVVSYSVNEYNERYEIARCPTKEYPDWEDDENGWRRVYDGSKPVFAIKAALVTTYDIEPYG